MLTEIGALAAEIQTTGEGASLTALQKTVRRRGLQMQG
jgi:hypothetical protein